MSDPIVRLNVALDGRYEIERELGHGGMATVYLAKDLKHNRSVALKVLKPELAAAVGAERFLAEIETTANLQHPHILPLFDSGEADSFLFYVMPYVEGETLGDRLKREKQLPVDTAVRIASDVAEALHAAHERGVIHRDIKPANILLTSGRPLVADFGIALAVSAAGGGRMTETGLSMGTPHYMSPEQVSGDQEPSASSDVYSLGCVLYEMLVGQPPHTGNTTQAVLMKVFTEDVEALTKSRASIPANVDAAIRKALEKLPADRFAGAQDFAKALGDPGFRHMIGAGVEVPERSDRWKRVSFAASALAVLAATVAVWSFSRPAPPLPVERFVAPFGDAQEPPFPLANAFDLSRDGSVLVYRAPGGGQGPNQLWMRRWDELEPAPIRGTGTSLWPALSPDGQEVAFQLYGEVNVSSLVGGSVRTLTTGVSPHWGRDGYVYATSGSAIVRLRPTGGAVDSVARAMEGLTWVSDVLPGGEAALLRTTASDGEAQVQALRLETGELTLLAVGDAPRYAASGHILYVADSMLMAARFDPDALELRGEPVPVLQDVLAYALSDSGKLFYTRTLADAGTEFVWVDRLGQALPVDPGWTFYQGVGNAAWSLSPEGARVAFRAVSEGNDDIWIKDLISGASSRLTFDEGQDWSPHWSPDGTMVTFVSDRRGDRDLWTKRADGTGVSQLLYDHETRVVEGFWGPNDEWLVFRGGAAGAGDNTRDILGIRPGVDTVAIPLLAEGYDEQRPALSHDGRWVAYVSNEDGTHQLFVRPFPAVDDGKVQVSTNGGIMPLWSHDGRELFFVDGSNDLIAVEVELGATFRVVGSEALFKIPYSYRTSQTNSVYGVSPDDQRFLMARSYQPLEGTPSSFVLVQNWLEELKRLVPD